MLYINPIQVRRSGLTLVEVLASIFILAIGALSVLVLFPVAALKVRTAMANESIALMAANGDSSLRLITKYRATNFPLYDTLSDYFTGGGGTNWRFIGPNVGLPRARVALLDPYFAGSGFTSISGTTLITRQGLEPSFDGKKEGFFSLEDLIEFESNGNPSTLFSRSQKYTCAFLVRQNPTSPPTYQTAVIVYQGRNVIAAVPESITEMTLDAPGGEDVNKNGSTTIKVTGSLPTVDDGRAIQPGAWILVTTAGTEDLFDFYQVTKTSEKSGAVYLELNKSISTASGLDLSGKCYWVDSMVGYFPKGTIDLD